MNFQNTPWNCGPAALQNALAVLRFPASQNALAKLAGTSEGDGTDEEGIKRAAIAQGCTVDEIAVEGATTAWTHLGYSLLVGRPVVACIDRWTHWVTVIGLCGKTVIIAEPARTALTLGQNGILVMGRDRFLHRWRAGRRVAKDLPQYYGIAVGRTP